SILLPLCATSKTRRWGGCHRPSRNGLALGCGTTERRSFFLLLLGSALASGNDLWFDAARSPEQREDREQAPFRPGLCGPHSSAHARVVSSDYFDGLGVEMHIGRGLSSDPSGDRENVAVLDYRF